MLLQIFQNIGDPVRGMEQGLDHLRIEGMEIRCQQITQIGAGILQTVSMGEAVFRQIKHCGQQGKVGRQFAGDTEPGVLPRIVMVGGIVDEAFLPGADDKALSGADAIAFVLDIQVAEAAADMVDNGAVEAYGSDSEIRLIKALTHLNGVQITEAEVQEQLNRCWHDIPSFAAILYHFVC